MFTPPPPSGSSNYQLGLGHDDRSVHDLGRWRQHRRQPAV